MPALPLCRPLGDLHRVRRRRNRPALSRRPVPQLPRRRPHSRLRPLRGPSRSRWQAHSPRRAPAGSRSSDDPQRFRRTTMDREMIALRKELFSRCLELFQASSESPLAPGPKLVQANNGVADLMRRLAAADRARGGEGSQKSVCDTSPATGRASPSATARRSRSPMPSAGDCPGSKVRRIAPGSARDRPARAHVAESFRHALGLASDQPARSGARWRGFGVWHELHRQPPSPHR